MGINLINDVDITFNMPAIPYAFLVISITLLHSSIPF